MLQTPVAVRFSLVTHGRDSPEGLRDVRGFATKFYTSEGNWDLVGNNIPVSFFHPVPLAAVSARQCGLAVYLDISSRISR